MKEEEFCFDSSSNGAAAAGDRTLLLVGQTGNGKSATANSILGRKAFLSKTGSSSVTLTTQLQQNHFFSHTFTVIDTPGLFDCSLDHRFVGSEIIKCFQMASAGVHSILVVFSLRNRFTKEEEAVIHSLKVLFGEKIYDYMILVFTNGDVFDEEEECFEDYLDNQSSLQEILQLCKNRIVLFDNRTKDKEKQTQEFKNLLAMVEKVMNSNGGRPYTNQIFQKLDRVEKKICVMKERIKLFESVENSNCELCKLMEKRNEEYEERIPLKKRHKGYEEQFKQMIQTVESKMTEQNLILKQELIKEKNALLNAKEKVAQIKLNLLSEIDDLQKARGCAIM